MTLRLTLFMLVLVICRAAAAEYKAGVARVDITPEDPIRMAGYAARKEVSRGVAMQLWAKALAIEDRKGSRVVLVTTDLIGLPASVSDVVAAEVTKSYGLERSRLILNSSHTHAGPVVWRSGRLTAELPDEQKRVVMEYRSALVGQLVALVGAALERLTPVELHYGTGEARFAVNRREKTPAGVKIGVNPGGPTDPRVPVIRITRPDGSILAVVFGYACHNTTLVGTNLTISGDYAGHAQALVEETYPGSTALFVLLCGGDQNPNPRGDPAHVLRHGAELAAGVRRAIAAEPRRISGDLRTAFRVQELALQEPFARPVLYPIQAVRFGRSLVLVALGGEVVVEYGLRISKEFPELPMIVAGYSNSVMAYIPTARMLKEGGYEPVDSMQYFDLPSPFQPDVEDRIMSGVREVLRRIGVR